VALFGDVPEELPLGIALVLHEIDVDRDGNKRLIQDVDDALIGKSGRTARNSIVSDTAKRITIHRPDKHWLVLLRRDLHAFPETGNPRDLSPSRVVVRWQHKLVNRIEVVGRFESRIKSLDDFRVRLSVGGESVAKQHR
jgi:hypothetical protein